MILRRKNAAVGSEADCAAHPARCAVRAGVCAGALRDRAAPTIRESTSARIQGRSCETVYQNMRSLVNGVSLVQGDSEVGSWLEPSIENPSCPNAAIGHPARRAHGFPLKTCGNDGEHSVSRCRIHCKHRTL